MPDLAGGPAAGRGRAAARRLQPLLGLLARLAVLLCLALGPGLAAAETLAEARAREALWSHEVRTGVQDALVWTGDYAGRLDGAFGPGTRAAIRRFQLRHGFAPTGWLRQPEIALLQRERQQATRAFGWRLRRFPRLGIEVGIPEALVGAPVPGEGVLRFPPASAEAPRLALWAFPRATPAEFADFARAFARDPAFRADRTQAGGRDWTVWSGVEDGRRLYVTAINTPHGLKAFSLSYPERLGPLLDRLAVAMFNSLAALPGAAVEARPAPATPPRSTGTGFYVNAEGAVLSNAHVVRGCGSLTVDGRLPARLLAVDPASDLAVLGVEGAPGDHLRFRRQPARLNEDITIVGYPLRGLLGAINVTRGAISSLAGLRGNPRHLQVSAPVQPGNSGGPVVDASGAVVGVVQSKLDAAVIAALTGDIPQNVNFAINATVAQDFLAAHGIAFEHQAEAPPLSPTELAETVRRATVLIECR